MKKFENTSSHYRINMVENMGSVKRSSDIINMTKPQIWKDGQLSKSYVCKLDRCIYRGTWFDNSSEWTRVDCNCARTLGKWNQ